LPVEKVQLATKAVNILPTQATQVRPKEIEVMAISQRANTKETHQLIKTYMKKYIDEYNKYNFNKKTQKTNFKEGDWVC
jgi:Tfp pilus assembly protein PilZ